MKQSIKLKRRRTHIRPLVGAGIFTSTLLSVFLSPKQVLAVCPSDITNAGSTITNKASVSYSDGATNFTQESNEVQVQVAEIAGITVTALGDQDINTSSRNLNDVVGFDFLVTNTGNDPTYFFLPGSTNVNLIGAALDTSVSATSVRVMDHINNTTNATTAVNTDVIAAGQSTSAIAGIPDAGLIKPGDQVRVRVYVRITESRAAFPVSVQYGNTGPNDNSSATQNQPDAPDTPLVNEVRTIDYVGGPISADGCAEADTTAPANGEREAAGFYEIRVGTDADPLAMARVSKTKADQDQGADKNVLTDDTIAYRLDLSVDSIQLDSNFVAAPLTGTNINGLGQGVLVSDAIPAGTRLTDFDPSTLAFDSPPSRLIGGANWQLVYTTAPLTTNPTTEAWTLGPIPDAATAATVTRIGWFYDTDPGNDSIPVPGTVLDDVSLALNYTTANDSNGFKFRVVVSDPDKDGNPLQAGDTAATGTQISNIAQAFGQTFNPVDTNGDGTNDSVSPLVDTTGDGTPDAPVIIYDESGDEKPNNFSDDNTPKDNPNTPSVDGSYFNPLTNDGIARPTVDDIDGNNNNTGRDRDPANGGGEDNFLNLNLNPPAPTSGILNGPGDQVPPIGPGFPDAVGPNSNNDDYTEKATDPSTAVTLEAPTIFYNTVRNPGTNADDLDNVVILPITVAQAEQASGHNGFGALDGSSIPDGTTITIILDINKDGIYSPTGVGGDQVATYTYSNSGAGGTWTLGPNLNLPGGASGVTIDKLIVDNGTGVYDVTYQVILDPPNTVAVGQFIPIPIVAYPENTAGSGFNINNDSVYNLTIDKLFIGGFLDVQKYVRLLDASGNIIKPYTQNPADPDNNPATNDGWGPQPGQILEYKIEYKNNATRDLTGTGNVTLQVAPNTLVITEDGRVDFTDDATYNLSGNNWALNNQDIANPDTNIDTSHVPGSVNATRPGTFAYFNSAATAVPASTSGVNGVEDVTRYTYTQTGGLLPQERGEFTFRRRVN